MTGLEIFRDSGTTAGEIADIVSNPCPPVVPEVCDKFSCRECWQAWLGNGKTAEGKGAIRQADDPGRGRAASQPRRDVRQGAPQGTAYAS